MWCLLWYQSNPPKTGKGFCGVRGALNKDLQQRCITWGATLRSTIKSFSPKKGVQKSIYSNQSTTKNPNGAVLLSNLLALQSELFKI